MRRRLLVATALGVVAIGSVAAAWLQEPAALTAADAADAAEEAFADVGLEASLQGEPLATTYHGAGREPVDPRHRSGDGGCALGRNHDHGGAA